MRRISADELRELIIYVMIENAKARAAASPIVHSPFLDVDLLGQEFDQALDEINQVRANTKGAPLEVDADFKQAVIDSLMRRMEHQQRVVYQV